MVVFRPMQYYFHRMGIFILNMVTIFARSLASIVELLSAIDLLGCQFAWVLCLAARFVTDPQLGVMYVSSHH